MPNKLQVGANIICRINGQDYGIVSGIQYTLTSPSDEERGIDAIEPFELSATITQVQGVIQVFMLRNDEGLEGRNITAGMPYIPEERYFSLMLQDRYSGFMIFKADYCRVESQSWNMQTKSIVTGQFAFRGLTARNHFNQR